MVPNRPAMLRALLLAKQIAAKTDPGFAGVSIPIPGEAIPLARAAGGYIPHGSPERQENLDKFMEDAHPLMKNADGSPKTFYHGTKANVKSFDPNKIGNSDLGSIGQGFYASEHPDVASLYSSLAPISGYSNVMPIHINSKNPYIYNLAMPFKDAAHSKRFTDELKKMGHDAIIKHGRDGSIDEVVAFYPHQIKSAVGNRGTFDSTKLDINKAAGGQVDDTNNLNDMGLYSQAAKAASALKQAKGLPQDMLRAVSTAPGVKKDELHWSGVQDKFAGQSGITKDDLAQHFQDNMPKIHEQTFTSGPQNSNSDGPTRYDDHAMPGGHFYREVLMHLPSNAKNSEQQLGVDYNSSHWDTPNVLAHLRMSDRHAPGGQKALHVEELQSDWGQHARKYGTLNQSEIADRRNAERAVVVSRAQFKQREKELANAMHNHDDMSHPDVQQAAQAYHDAKQAFHEADSHAEKFEAMGRTVPEGPYINKTENWTDLGLKRALTEAARGNYDKLVYTPGETQGKRYDLSQTIETLAAYPKDPDKKTLRLVAVSPNDEDIVFDKEMHVDELDKHVGKDAADKIRSEISWPEAQHGHEIYNLSSLYGGSIHDTEEEARSAINQYPESIRGNLGVRPSTKKSLGRQTVIDGLNIQHGGEGMKGYYDKLLPERLLKLAREHDPEAQLGHHVVEGSNERNHITLPGLTITPRMRESILKRGFKAFADGGMVDQDSKGGAVDGDGDDTYPETGSIYNTPDGFAGGGMVMDKQKAIRRALMTATALHRADGGETEPKKYNLINNGQRTAPISETSNPLRIKFDAQGPGGVKGIIVPRHMWEGGNGKNGRIAGMNEVNDARAEVYGSEPRAPLNVGQIEKAHKDALEEHFNKPVSQQIADEKAALARLRAARHIGKTANTLDEGEKLDTVKHEYDDQGRSYVAYGAKGTAGHAVYSSGAGDDQKIHVLNTCPGQTSGCGGGVDKNGVVDTRRGMCFAPKAEAQYVSAAVRRASHTQAKHDPAMTKDWILAHTGSLRDAAKKADKTNNVVLFRPNVLDETDRSTRYVIKGLNSQRKESNLPPIIANSYGKTTELHDPENGYYITHSNIGPKTKLGASISENIKRDRQRIRSTITAADAGGKDFVNDEGHKTPPKNSYMVTDVARDSLMDAALQKSITHAKYWSTGRDHSELSPSERSEGPEGHFDGEGKPTTADKAHYGHTTLNGLRYDYQKQHILHPRYVKVGKNDDGSDHMIPTDSRFKDDDFLPKDRFKTKNGKKAGAIVLTTPTKSTSGIERQASFTHHVGQEHIKHAIENNGEYEIDPPHQQEAARGNEYKPPANPAGNYARGGSVHRHDDEIESTAFPEQSFQVQLHNAHKGLNEEDEAAEKRGYKKNKSPIEQDIVQRALRIAQHAKKPPRT
jgi:hypothetical protein